MVELVQMVLKQQRLKKKIYSLMRKEQFVGAFTFKNCHYSLIKQQFVNILAMIGGLFGSIISLQFNQQ